MLEKKCMFSDDLFEFVGVVFLNVNYFALSSIYLLQIVHTQPHLVSVK